ncbi:hypothetical protein [Desulforamulus aquiferis]|uniref:Uncharacterized protein n=1 Tax=Desulforamulus aquiferis TaxID=1397668 RepID=A0AAW7ZH76_9FIRM|nr:hypothetical protein [Desulforamulus aquiferis]MDO7789124.1 hypothetical protein [Desulforamulus aquiferis]
MKPAGTKRPPKGVEFQQIYEPDMSRMVKALRAVLESRPKPSEPDQEETKPAAGDKQAG